MPLGRRSKRQLAVRSQTDQTNHLSALELIDEHQIREDMTVAISLPVGSELMVTKPDWQRLIDQKKRDHIFESGIQLGAIDAFGIFL